MTTTCSISFPRILVVESEPDLQVLLDHILTEEGYGVTLVSSQETALCLLVEQPYQLVLTDLFGERPQVRWHNLQQIAQRCSPTPVGIITAWNVTCEEVQHNGGAFRLLKPFDLDDLTAQVAAHVLQPLSAGQRRSLR